MKKIVLPAIMVLCAVLTCSAGAYALEMVVDNNSAWTIYRENEDIGNTNLSSDAGAFYNRTTFTVADYDNKKLEGEIRWGMGFAYTATERWYLNSSEVQKNKLSFMDMDMGILIGWSVPIGEFFRDCKIVLTPLGGYRYKWTRYRRSDFVTWQKITFTETIDEIYNVQSIDLGGRFNIRVNDKYNLYAKPIFGIVVYNSADNSAQGVVEGQGGMFLNCDVGMEYPITESFTLGAAGRIELQHLRGGEKNGSIWPDNSTYTYGGDISLSYKY